MKKPKAFLVVSAYNNDVSWVKKLTNNYIIYDKSHTLKESKKIIRIPNVGYNIFDMCHYIVNNYDNLPKFIAFLEGNPFDHCKEETFYKLIYNTEFTPIEDYSHVAESFAHIKDTDGGYMEINNSWYVPEHTKTHGRDTIKYYGDYFDFIRDFFERPYEPQYLRFAPGGQYIVPRENVLYYSKSFWRKLAGIVMYHRIPVEAHMIERTLWYIFRNEWKEKEYVNE